MSTEKTWYVVADGGKARIVADHGGEMRTVQHFDRSGHGDTGEDPRAGTSPLKAPRADPPATSKVAFARTVAARLNEAVRTGKIDEIVLAAPAHVLHEIRAELDKAATAKLGKSLSKDLTNTPDHELASHFG